MRHFAFVIAVGLIGLTAACTASATGPVSSGPNLTPPPTEVQWHPIDAQTGAIRDLDGLTKLAAAFPESGSVRLRLLNAQLQAGAYIGLLETLRWLNERGYVFSEGARSQIPKLVDDAYSDEAAALLLPEAPAKESSSIAWTVPAEGGLIESLIVDENPARMVATSVSGRAIWGTTPTGEWKPVRPPGADNLSGMVDEGPGRVLWVASGNIDGSQDEKSYFSGLLGLTGAPEAIRIPAPDGVTLSDLHLAGDGTIYASDPLGGGIYQLGPDREKVEVLIAPGTFRSPQGLVTSADGSLLYVNDYRYGLAVIDLSNGKVERLSSGVPIILDGGDALFRHGNTLVTIQNGTSPMRISHLLLSEDGLRVVGSRILEQAHPQWTEPLSGHLVGNTLYYVGNGQWDKYVAGVLAEGKQAEPTQIRRLPID